MPFTGLGLVFIAALLHATWNVLLKQTEERYIVTWWALLIGSLCFVPAFLVAHPLPSSVWPYVLASAVFEAVYFAVLSAAYGVGDFSVVYPVARGAAPAFLAVWTVFFLKELPTSAGVGGLLLIILGLILIGGSAWLSTKHHTTPNFLAVGLALFVAVCISLYSVIDGAAVSFAEPVPYTALVFALTTAILTPLMIQRYGWARLAHQWRKQWWRVSTIGILMMSSYMLVVSAYAFAPISYTGAIREVSIVFGAIFGWRWLGEGFGTARLAGAGILFVGILIIALAG